MVRGFNRRGAVARLGAACALACAWAACAAPAPCTLDENVVEDLRAAFVPDMPTVTMSYDVTYRFLGVRLMRIARADIRTTEGHWINRQTGRHTPACFAEMTLRTFNQDEEPESCRLYVNDRIVSVLTMPELDTIAYAKWTDEHINPIFGKAQRFRHAHMYDLESGALSFRSEDFLTGEVSTNLDGAADLMSQGKNVSSILKLMSEIYYGRQDMLNADSDFRLHVNIEGTAVPFAVHTFNEEAPLRFRERDWPSLCVEVEPAREAPDIKSNGFAMWATSFRDLAARMGSDELSAVADASPAWSMVPLVADYGLSLGTLRCAMTSIGLLPPRELPGFRLASAGPHPKEIVTP